MKYYMIEGKLSEGAPAGDAYRKLNYEHHSHIQQCFDTGRVIASGPIAGGRGGVILIRLGDSESVEEFCANDPFAKAKIQHYRITQFDLYQIQSYAERWKE